MKVIDLNQFQPTLADVLKLADRENLILKTGQGKQFIVAETDDFDTEIALVRGNHALMKFLAKRSKEKKKLSLAQVKKELNHKS